MGATSGRDHGELRARPECIPGRPCGRARQSPPTMSASTLGHIEDQIRKSLLPSRRPIGWFALGCGISTMSHVACGKPPLTLVRPWMVRAPSQRMGGGRLPRKSVASSLQPVLAEFVFRLDSRKTRSRSDPHALPPRHHFSEGLTYCDMFTSNRSHLHIAVDPISELVLELQGMRCRWSGSPSGRRAHEPDVERQLAGDARIVPAHENLPASHKRCRRFEVILCAESLFIAARGTDEAVRPAHFDQPGGAGVIVREHVLEGEEAVGDLFHAVAQSAGTYGEHSTRSPALTSTSTSGGKLSRPEPCA